MTKCNNYVEGTEGPTNQKHGFVDGTMSEPVALFTAKTIHLQRSLFTSLVAVMADELDEHLLAAYYLSAVSCLLRGMEDVIADYYNGRNLTVRYLKFPEEAPVLPVPEKFLSFEECWVTLCQLVLIVFKNVTRENYLPFMRNRTRALKALIGGATMPEGYVVVPLKQAQIIHNNFTAERGLKIHLLDTFRYLSGQETPLEAISVYICTILAWNGMAAFTFVYEMLILQRSPILLLPELNHEVRNMRDTFAEITNSEAPQYFRIYASSSQQLLLSRSRFPILLGVAARLKFENSGSVNRFTSTMGVSDAKLTKYIAMHKRVIQPRLMRMQLAAVSDLLNEEVGQEDADRAMNALLDCQNAERNRNNGDAAPKLTKYTAMHKRVIQPRLTRMQLAAVSDLLNEEVGQEDADRAMNALLDCQNAERNRNNGDAAP